MVQDDGARVQHGAEGVPVALEVRDQHLDVAGGGAVADGADAGGEDAGAAVGDVVAVDGGDDGVVEAERFDGLREADGFERVDRVGPAGVDRAEAAGAGAGVAQDHEGGGAGVVALADVRTARFLADGVELIRGDEVTDVLEALAAGELRLEPARFGLSRWASSCLGGHAGTASAGASGLDSTATSRESNRCSKAAR